VCGRGPESLVADGRFIEVADEAKREFEDDR
jgi:hypothetical protein